MKLKISSYGRLGELIGREFSFEAAAANAVGGLRLALAAAYPIAAADLLSPRVRVCVNDRMAGDEQPLEPGDEVALLPPVSGG